jgi:anti-sigma-K factor RskA
LENIIDLIYAYSLGCLDHEELQLVSEYLDTKEKVNLPILGEFQNLTALLPSTLKIEIPDPQLKDIVARRLYRLDEELKAQRQKNVFTTKIQDEIDEEVISNETEQEDEKDNPNNDQNVIDDNIVSTPDFLLKTPQDLQITEKETNNYPETKPIKTEIIPEENGKGFSKTDYNYKKINTGGTKDLLRTKTAFPATTAMPEKRKYNVLIWGGIITNIIVIGIIVLYFVMSSKTNNVYSDVARLKKQVESLNNQLVSAQEVQKMLQSPDVQVINMKGTIINPNGFGKLFIGSEKGIGYIQFAQMPSLPDDKSLQLWVKAARRVISLGIFQVSDNMGFYSFKIQSLPKGDNINFLITEEPKTGSITPSPKIYLTGKLNY